MKNHIIIPLSEILSSDKYSIEKLEDSFKAFKCEREEDLCDFLVRNAIAYDQKGIGKTFLFLNEKELLDKGKVVIDAYVTLATKGLDISSLTKSKKKKVFGSYPGVDNLNSISVFLIGQLGRADYCPKDEITGDDLLQECYHVFSEASRFVGGDLVFLECREHMFPKFYEKQGFHKFKQELNSDGLYELYLKANF